ncbi:MAG TPA: helix-turn-helix domain-containing protein [Candidatus Eisenbacteria bacterium]|nr:helix-turn-helix domain-containing protein [Candidatus Eisenbacteria bacterium]
MEEIKKCLEEASHFLDATMGATNKDGLIFAATDDSLIGTEDSSVKAFVLSGDNKTVSGGNTYIKLLHDQKLVAVVFINGTDVVSANYLELLAGWISSALKEKNTEEESEGFLKNVLLENELPGDIPLKAREFRIPYSQPRQAILLNFSENYDLQVKSALNNILEGDYNQHVLPMDEKNMVVLLDLGKYENVDSEDEKDEKVDQNLIEEIPEKIYDDLKESIESLDLNIGVGLKVKTLKDISRSYREASLALTVGKIFEHEQKIMYYNKLGLGRLIYQLPPTLCQMFLAEVFEEGTYEQLDPETLLTIDKFFENSLNGSETSRQLFVHRNTLVYRLDKVEKITGLDLRSFDDAVLFKLASMVRKYLESLQAEGTFNVVKNNW